MAEADDLPGDDEDYEDLDDETAIGMGILSELTAIRQELQLLRTAVMGEVEQPTVKQSSDNDFTCLSCSKALENETVAKKHAVAKHDAPANNGAWKRIIVGLEP